MHVLVAGCGWLGRALGIALVARHDRVTGVRRDPTRMEELRAVGIEPLALDLRESRVEEALPRDVDAIVACPSADGDTVDAYRAAYLEATSRLIAAARRRPVRAFVYTGSTGVFGQRDGSEVDERSSPAPVGGTAEVLAEAERLVRGAAADGSVPARLVRLSGLYGPGRVGVVERVRSGILALGPGDEVWTNWCHRDDAVDAVLAAIDRGRPGAVYHATDAHPARRRDLIVWIATRLGIEPARREREVSPGASRVANRRVSGAATRAELEIELRWPSFRDGLAPLIAAAGEPSSPG